MATTRTKDFIFSSTIAYEIEFGELYARFFFDGALLDGDGAPIVTPYLAADLPELNFRQIGDTMWITHDQYKPRKLTRTTVTTFSLDVITFTTGPFLIRNDILNDDAVTMKYTGALTTTSVGTLISSAAIFESGHVGGLFQLTHPVITADSKVSTSGASQSSALFVKGKLTFLSHNRWTGTAHYERKEGDNAFEIKTTQVSANDTNLQHTFIEREFDTQFRISPVAGMSASFEGDIINRESTTIGIVRIDSITSTTEAVCTVMTNMGGSSALTTLRWAEGAWSGVQGYPKSIAFFNGHAVYAGRRSLWLSRVGRFEFFDAGLLDDDAFTVELETTDEIMWVDTVKDNGKDVIVAGTTGQPWTLQSNKVGTVMTPTNFTIDELDGFGSANIQPIRVNSALIFVDSVQKKLVELAYNVQQAKVTNPDILSLAEDATATSKITWLAHQKHPDSIIWFGMADGTIHSLTYQRDQNVIAYAPHPMGTAVVESGSIIPATNEDEIWISVVRTIGGADFTFIERFHPRRITDEDDAHFVDSGVIYDDAAATVIPGGDHLEGETVQIWADGEVIASQAVSSGSITLAVAASKVHYGIGFTPQLKPMRLDRETAGGSTHGSIAHIPELVISLLESKNAKYGRSLTDLRDIPVDQPKTVNNSTVTGLFTGDVTVTNVGGFSIEDPIVISTDGPSPLAVRAIIARKDITGR